MSRVRMEGQKRNEWFNKKCEEDKLEKDAAWQKWNK